MTTAPPPGCRGRVPGGGYFVWADRPPGPLDDHRSGAAPILPAAEVVGVSLVPGARFYLKGGAQNQLRPAFSLYPPAALAEAASHLGALLRA